MLPAVLVHEGQRYPAVHLQRPKTTKIIATPDVGKNIISPLSQDTERQNKHGMEKESGGDVVQSIFFNNKLQQLLLLLCEGKKKTAPASLCFPLSLPPGMPPELNPNEDPDDGGAPLSLPGSSSGGSSRSSPFCCWTPAEVELLLLVSVVFSGSRPASRSSFSMSSASNALGSMNMFTAAAAAVGCWLW